MEDDMNDFDEDKLIRSAREDYHEYMDKFGDHVGNCSCHISPPCPSCTHPGNPENLAEEDAAWLPVKRTYAHIRKIRESDLWVCNGAVGRSPVDAYWAWAGTPNPLGGKL